MASHTYASFDHNHYIKQTFFFSSKIVRFAHKTLAREEKGKGNEVVAPLAAHTPVPLVPLSYI